MTTLIIGGTGKTGRRVAHLLTELGHPIRRASRTSEPAFDWTDPTTWEAALAGCTSAYVTFQPDIGLPGADEIVGAFADVAAAADCRRLVLLSGRGEEGARAAEQALVGSGADWTVLRASFFMQNFTESFFAEELQHGSLTMVEHAVGEPFIDADDIAEVAVAALLDDSHVGRTHELTGPELLTFADVASAIGAATGRPVESRQLPVQDYVDELVGAGLPVEDATGLAYLFHEVLDGRNAHVDDGVRNVLGREPRDFATFLAALAGDPVRG